MESYASLVQKLPSFVFLLLKAVYLDDSIQIHRSKQVGERVFSFVDLFELELSLELRNFDFKNDQTSAASVEALSGLWSLLLGAEMDETLLKNRFSRELVSHCTESKEQHGK
jgi:hypothetical protein